MASALRFASGITNISSAATTIAHGLKGTPTEYGAACMIAVSAAVNVPYFLGVSQTNLVLAVGIGGMSACVCASMPHSYIK